MRVQFLGLLFATAAFAQAPWTDAPGTEKWFRPFWAMEKFSRGIVTTTLVIHHTASSAPLSAEELSAIGYERQYKPRYTMNADDPVVKDQEPFSGHMRLGQDGKLRQIFPAYHWTVAADGTATRLLEDYEVGWHAGNWNKNMEAIGIVLDGNLTTHAPTKKQMRAVAKLIRQYTQKYPSITHLTSHRDVRKNTECPGPWFSSKQKWGFFGGIRTGREQLLRLAHVNMAP